MQDKRISHETWHVCVCVWGGGGWGGGAREVISPPPKWNPTGYTSWDQYCFGLAMMQFPCFIFTSTFLYYTVQSQNLATSGLHRPFWCSTHYTQQHKILIITCPTNNYSIPCYVTGLACQDTLHIITLIK